MTLQRKYEILYRQGFAPIFVADQFDAVLLAEASIAAGAKVIEVTCRRPNALAEIKQIKQLFPELIVLAGSVVDDGPMLEFLRRRRTPPMPSLAQLSDAGADGFVSAMPLSLAAIGRWSKSHLLLPGTETVAEAVAALEAGAHFAKLFTADLVGGPARVKRLTSAPLHGLLPLFVTGGVTTERMPEYVAAGAILLGSGWDLMLGADYAALQANPDRPRIAGQLERFLTAMRNARDQFATPVAKAASLEGEVFLAALPHLHPFNEKPAQ